MTRRARSILSLMTFLALGRVGVHFWSKKRPSPFGIHVQHAVFSSASGSRFNLVTKGICKSKDGSRAKYGVCGEDAYFISESTEKTGRLSVFAVADGVGGWVEHGGDSSQVSNAFMASMKHVHAQGQFPEPKLASLIKQCYASLLKSRKLSMGTTTICAAAFDHASGELDVCNIGDSQLVVIRDGAVVLEVEAGVWAFNSPNQIGFGVYGEPQGDVDEVVLERKLALQRGDVIVVGTDGLFDNVFVEDIAKLVKEHADGSPARVDRVARVLLSTAYRLGKDDEYVSPFAKEAIQMGKAPPHYCGGKPDDISIIVAAVQ